MNQNRNIKKIYHAAIYVRLSKEDGDIVSANKRESNSISNQKDLIKNFLKDKKDIVVVSERVDDGYSGSNFERPAFQMMLEDIRRGVVDCVVVKDLSRFGREYIDAGKYIERIFPALGVRFIAINDNYDSLEGKSQADEIVIPFKNLINDAYCRDISIKIRSHLEVKRKNGEYIGAFTPYGYKKDDADKNKLVVDTYAADIVKEIFRLKLSGMSQTAIANYLNDQGVLSPMEYKHSLGINIQDNFKRHEQAEWSAMSVKRVLENEVYIGTLIQGRHTTPNHKVKKLMDKPEKDWIRIEHNHEPIVTEREFTLVQRLLGLDTRTSPNGDKVYPLSGLAVCGDCGALMIKRDVPAGGKVYSYYRNYVEAGSYIERVFPFFNVRFISVNDHYDSKRDDVSLLVGMSNIYNEFYSRDLAKKVRSSYRINWANGEFPSGVMAYGYEKDPKSPRHLIPDPEVAPVVKRIFRMFMDGETYAEIARTLNMVFSFTSSCNLSRPPFAFLYGAAVRYAPAARSSPRL